jgi:hypothetical protein
VIRARRVATALFCLFGLDLFAVLVAGQDPLLRPLGLAHVSALGFTVRALLLASCLGARFIWLAEGVPDRPRVLLLLLLLPVLGELHLADGRPFGEHVRGLLGCLGGFTAVVLIHELLRRHFRESTALGATLLAWFATFLHWQMTEASGAWDVAAAGAAALVLLLWDGGREDRGKAGFFVIGLAIGLALRFRGEGSLLLLLPALEIVTRLRRRTLAPGQALLGGALLVVGAWAVAAPWSHPSHLPRFDHPALLNMLFSARHGLLSWTPVFWAGYLGFLPLLRRNPRFALPLVLLLLMGTYTNACLPEWWGDESFSNARFDSLLAVLAIGLAASIDWARAFVGRHPHLALGLLAAPLVLWNLALVEMVRRGSVPRDSTVDGPWLAGNAAELVSGAVGFPTTWPASWIFARQERARPAQYDFLAGRYFFSTPEARDRHIALGSPEDLPLLAEGWGPIERDDQRSWRRALGEARIMAPLAIPEDLEVRVRAAAATEAGVLAVLSVNGSEAARFLVDGEWGERRVRVPAPFWRREINHLVLSAGGAVLRVEAVDLIRVGAKT